MALAPLRCRSGMLTGATFALVERRVLDAAVAFALVVAVAGCGLRTPVRPPEDTAPVIPGAVTATREDDVVVVRWKRAERSADGARLDDLAAFVVERKLESDASAPAAGPASGPADDSAKDSADDSAKSSGWSRVASIDVIDQEKIRRRRDFSWRDPEAKARAAMYRVRAVTADGQEGPATDPATAVEK